MRTGFCQKRASVPRFLETRKLGLAGPLFLQVNQLNSGGGLREGGEIGFHSLTFLSFPPHPLTPTHSTAFHTAPPLKLPGLLLCPCSGLPASSEAGGLWGPGQAATWGFAAGLHLHTSAGLSKFSEERKMRWLGWEKARISQKEQSLGKDKD